MSSAAVANRASTFAFSSGFGVKPKIYSKDGSGSLFMDGVAVFRSGTFRDSEGYQGTWEKLHIDQMVRNWEHLQSSKIFTDVPVRDGHKGWLINNSEGNGRVVGWHTNLRSESMTAPHDGQTYDYLLADFEITDPFAKEQINNGTWRNLSSEIGYYLSNAEAEYWPVYMGVAYVDIPAVEGLKFTSPNGSKFYMLEAGFNSKENGVTDTTQTTPTTSSSTGTGTALPFGNDSAPAFVFSVNGQRATDYAQVQAHINALELFRSETMEQNRRSFVTKLAADNKILATQIEAHTNFALGLTAEQFTAWCGTWDSSAKVPAVSPQDTGVTNPDNSAQSVDPTAEQYSIWQDTVRAHVMAGQPAAAIKETPSYKNLIAAGQTPAVKL